MEKILFRASRNQDLLTDEKGGELTDNQKAELKRLREKKETPKGITVKQEEKLKEFSLRENIKPSLSDTAKSFVDDVYLLNKYGYKEPVVTDVLMKGELCEGESRQLIQDVLGGEYRIFNKENYKNDFITGTPDVILQKEDCVEDIKNNFTVKTFYKVGKKPLCKTYITQLQCYMWLTGKSKARLIYTLNKTPDELIEEQKKKYFFKFGCDEENIDYKTICLQIDHNNNIIDLLTQEQRVKSFEIERCELTIEKLKQRVLTAREYYSTLKL